MRKRTWHVLLLLGLVTPTLRPADAQVADDVKAEQVRQAIERGIDYLKSTQSRTRGNWIEYPGYSGGVTALCTLALLNAGVEPADPAIQKALAHLRKQGDPAMVYTTALQTMVFCAAEPQKDRLLIRRNVAWLERVQSKDGDHNGGWSYGAGNAGPGGGSPDNSNSQFALLALYEAQHVGVEVSSQTWGRALAYWQRHQHADGSWRYRPSAPATGSMTCAGIASMVIASGRFSRGDATVENGIVRCCGKQEQIGEIQRGLDWLGRNFSVKRNPSLVGGRSNVAGKRYLFYYLYGVERVGRMTGHRFIGRSDWYREGAKMLAGSQDPLNGSWKGPVGIETNEQIATAFALLFLSKGRRPVLIAKYRREPDDDWNYHRADLAHLTRHVEKSWRRDMTWQVIDARAATVDDLLQTPVLFISGCNDLRLSDEQKANLRQYVNLGGFVFAESCCEGRQFDRKFRDLMGELFPDSKLRLLPPDHPVWFAEEKVNPKYIRPLWGVDACCRTSVVYCPKDLSCYWELAQEARAETYPPAVRDEIAACLAIGANVLAYATNRRLKDKLDTPQIALAPDDDRALGRGTLSVVKLRHGGGSDDAPLALSNLLQLVGDQTTLRVNPQKRLLPITDPELAEYPLAFMHGRRPFQLSATERKALAQFIEGGGVVFADAICAAGPFADAFRREMKAVLPQQTWKRIPPGHPMFTSDFRGFDVTQVTLRDPRIRAGDGQLRARFTQIAPLLEGIEIDGRFAVVFSPYDISCAMENQASLECKGYTQEDAARIGTNVILYALQQ